MEPAVLIGKGIDRGHRVLFQDTFLCRLMLRGDSDFQFTGSTRFDCQYIILRRLIENLFAVIFHNALVFFIFFQGFIVMVHGIFVLVFRHGRFFSDWLIFLIPLMDDLRTLHCAAQLCDHLHILSDCFDNVNSVTCDARFTLRVEKHDCFLCTLRPPAIHIEFTCGHGKNRHGSANGQSHSQHCGQLVHFHINTPC